MKKKFLFSILLIGILVLTACGNSTDENVEYSQKILQKPDRIEKERAGATLVYEQDDATYTEIFDAINDNWWMISEDDAESVTDDALKTVETAEQIKTTSTERYVSEDNIIVKFIYEEEPVQWQLSGKETLEIKLLAFILPEKSTTDQNTRGIFLISETENIGVNEGVYTYYYDDAFIDAMLGSMEN